MKTFRDIIGQAHAIPTGELLITNPPPCVFVVGPVGVGRTTYARVLIEGYKCAPGSAVVYNDGVPHVVEETDECILLDPTTPFLPADWGRLEQLLTVNPEKKFIVIVERLESIPKTLAGRGTRVVLHPIPPKLLYDYAEHYLVSRHVPYDVGILGELVRGYQDSFPSLKTALGLIEGVGGLGPEILDLLPPNLTIMATHIIRLICQGKVGEAKEQANTACKAYTPHSLVQRLLTLFLEAKETDNILYHTVSARYPSIDKVISLLLPWANNTETQIGDKVGGYFVDEIHKLGLPIATAQSTTTQTTPQVGGRPSTPTKLDSGFLVNPRVTQQQKLEAQKLKEEQDRLSRARPSTVIYPRRACGTNPFGFGSEDIADYPTGDLVLPGALQKAYRRAVEMSVEEIWALFQPIQDQHVAIPKKIVTYTREPLILHNPVVVKIPVPPGVDPETLRTALTQTQPDGDV